MKILTLATSLHGPLRLHDSPHLVGPEHLPATVAARIANAPRGRLLAWSAPEIASTGFSQDGRSLVLPRPVMSAGIGSMKRAKGSGFVTLYVRTEEARMVDVLGSETFQQETLDGLLAQRDALGELLGCALDVEDWGFDC